MQKPPSKSNLPDPGKAGETPGESERRYRAIFENMADGCCVDEVIYRDGRPVDYRILEVNPAYERITGIPREKATGALASELYGTGEAPFLDVYTRVAETGEPAAFEGRLPAIGKYFSLTVTSPGPGKFSTIFRDVTAWKRLEERQRFRIAFQRIVAEASSALVAEGTEEQFDRTVNDTLRLLAELFGLDRGYLFVFSPDLARMTNTHEWCAAGITPQKDRIRDFPTAALPWWKDQILRKQPVHIPEVEALPPEAEAAKREWQAQDIKSLLCLPMVSWNGELVGLVGLDAVRRPRRWPEEEIGMLRLVSDIFGNVFERRRSEEKLRQRLVSEKIVSRVSTLSAEAGEVEEFLDRSLTAMGEVLEISRVYIFEHREQTGTLDNTFEWTAPGVDPQKEELQGIPSADVSWWMETLRSNRVINYSDIEDIPDPGARKILRRQKILSILVVPIFVSGRYWGFMGFDENTARRWWLPEDVELLQSVARIIAGTIERDRADRELRRLEWLLTEKPSPEGESYIPSYGDLAELNTGGLILDSVGRTMLTDIVRDYLDILETSAAVYEKNGDYALGIFSSGWCRFLDEASRRLCATGDNREAVRSERWLCHESCWTNASKTAIETGQPVDIECEGGLKIHSVPIRAGGEVVGALNFGYGDPPRDPGTLARLAARYEVDEEELRGHAEAYESRPPYLIGIARRRAAVSARLIGEIIERRQAETATRESEEFIRAVMDNLPVGVAVNSVDPEVKFTYMNDKFPAIYRTTREALTAGSFWEVVYEDPVFREQLKKRVVDDCLSGDRERMQWDDVPFTRDGKTYYICARNIPVPGQPLMISTVWDVTERKRAAGERERLQTKLAQAQKLESVGRLAGGVAHDFNNMLNVILGRGELALRALDPSHPAAGDLKEISSAARSSADLTRQLLAFARKQTASPRVLDLNETVGQMLKMLGRLIGEEIELKWSPGPGLWPVRIDPAQVDQVLANLAVNARDAVGGKGRLEIATTNLTLDESSATDHPGSRPGDYVMLSVRDNGCGMDGETRAQIFEPFFTTKEKGQGTGLGLPMVWGIVEQNGGFIGVESRPGEGTTFRVCLPRHRGKSEQAPEPAPAPPSPRGRETVLVAEDDHANLRLTTRILKSQGYEVISAATPGEAIARAREHPGEIDLLLTDVVMPEMNGRALAKNLLSLYPEMKRLFMSGYTADVIAHHGMIEDGVRFIQKPFSIDDLLSRVREALDADS